MTPFLYFLSLYFCSTEANIRIELDRKQVQELPYQGSSAGLGGERAFFLLFIPSLLPGLLSLFAREGPTEEGLPQKEEPAGHRFVHSGFVTPRNLTSCIYKWSVLGSPSLPRK
eukprot:Hpha_TRINITY_DN13016_c0_g1::TRINITY_DN13016_c0_g1_i1::g.68854::m.68854